MKASWRPLVLVVFLVGLLLTGMTGTSASMTFAWPVYTWLGLAAVLSIGLLFEKVSFPLPKGACLAALTLVGYLLYRASDSPVAYFAREDGSLFVVATLVYGLALVLLTTHASRARFVEILAVLVALNLAFALAQVLVSPTLWIIPGYERTVVDRVGGLFNHPDHFAGFLAMLVPLWLATAVFSRRGRTGRIGAWILAASSVLVVVLSGSGSAAFALLAGLLAFASLSGLILWHKLAPAARQSILKFTAISAPIVLIVLFAASGPLARAIDRTLLTKGGELSLPEVWKSGWEQVAQAPLLGTGSRTSYLYGRLFRSELADSSGTEPEFIHNEYLQTFADYGLVGLLLLLLAASLHFRIGFRFVRAYADFKLPHGAIVPKSDHLSLVLGAIASLAGLGTLSAFDFPLHLPGFLVVAAVFLAILAAPDPMAGALKPSPTASIFPGGGLLFANRALLFGGGLAITLLGSLFSRSEYHYEMARLSFESDPAGFQHLRHLKEARSLDPRNPYVFSLSAHAQVAAILPEMPDPARLQALEQADSYFSHAKRLYPQDIFAAIGHAAVLDELNRPSEAMERLREARKAAPHYGNVILAEAEHFLRNGRIEEAEQRFAEAMEASAFRDTAAAQRGLMTVTEWKLIAEQDGVDWRAVPDPVESAPLIAGPEGYRAPTEATIAERDLAGKAPKAIEEKKAGTEPSSKGE